MKLSLELDYEQVDHLVKSSLMEDYINISKEIRRLEEKGELKEHHLEDLTHNKRWKESVKSVLEYYMDYDSYHSFIENNG